MPGENVENSSDSGPKNISDKPPVSLADMRKQLVWDKLFATGFWVLENAVSYCLCSDDEEPTDVVIDNRSIGDEGQFGADPDLMVWGAIHTEEYESIIQCDEYGVALLTIEGGALPAYKEGFDDPDIRSGNQYYCVDPFDFINWWNRNPLPNITENLMSAALRQGREDKGRS